MLASSGVSTRQIGWPLVFKHTGTIHRWSRPLATEADRKKRLCATGTVLDCFSESVSNGTPGCAIKLDMILSTGRCELAVCAFQKSSAVAFAYRCACK